MATILRVKRKKDEEPLDALLISCKRPKVESGEASLAEDSLTAVVEFAGTVEKQEDCVVKHIAKSLNKDSLKTSYKQHIVNISEKMREKIKQHSHESRYKVVNNIRSVDAALTEQLKENVVNIIDLEDNISVPDEKNVDEYVYDLYYGQTKDTLQFENLLSICPIEGEELVYEDYYRDDEKDICESEDSNSESNWKNDYPDSDYDNSENSIGENDIRMAMKNLDIEDELSSDEDLVYGLDKNDVDTYGYKYAKFKARIKKQEEGYDDSCDTNSNDSDSEKNEFDETYDE